VKKDVWYCLVCGRKIEEKERYVLLGTYEDKKIIEERYFHIKCFGEWFNKKVNEKARNSIQKMQQGAISLMENLKGITVGFGGMDKLQSMLGIDLDREINIDDINLGVKNKKEKNGSTKRKS